MAANREAAGESLKAVALAGLAERDESVAVTYSALSGIIAALLDVADAIREQTEALHLGGIRDDLGAIAHELKEIR